MFFNRLKRTFKRLSSKFTWKRRFPGNTWLGENVVGVENIEIGKGTYGCINILTSATNPRLIIGSFCSIAKDVTFVIEDDHPMNLLSTFPFRVKCLGESVVEASGKGGIVIEDDVWLGYRATVLDGVKIGQGGVVAAGALVTKDVPPYTIVGGVPARPIRKRFDDDTVDLLIGFDFSKIDENWIRGHIGELYRPMDQYLALELLNSERCGDGL